MSDTKLNPGLTTPLVHQVDYAGEVQANIPYSNYPSKVMDVYYPEKLHGPVPAVVLVTGFSDSAYEARMGLKLKDVMWYRSWAKLIAASGLIGITYSNNDPHEDVRELFQYLRTEGSAFGIDGSKLGILSQSANVPNALSLLMSDTGIDCATLLYGYTLDIGESTLVADALSAFGMPRPEATGDQFPAETSMLLVRAGKEEHESLNDSIDLFAAEALRRNAPISLFNYPQGTHCFDLFDDSPTSVAIIKQVISYFQSRLAADL